MAYRVKTSSFEGPFDLLLQLVTRQKVDIAAISISEVVEQYLAEVEALGKMDLDVASDFLLVASSLLEIKAASLLPIEASLSKDMFDDEDEDFSELSVDEMRDILLSRLLLYKQFKSAAVHLQSRALLQSCMHPRTAGPDPEYLRFAPDYLDSLTLHSLAVICADLNSRKDEFLLEAEHIAPKRQALETRVKVLEHLVSIRKTTSLLDLIQEDQSVENLVVSFLALLELAKSNKIVLRQDANFGDIFVSCVD